MARAGRGTKETDTMALALAVISPSPRRIALSPLQSQEIISPPVARYPLVVIVADNEGKCEVASM
jgi:hypothetical protein